MDDPLSQCRETVLALLAARSATATLCPSEAARALVPGGAWRDAMPLVHGVVDQLLEEGRVRLSWKGRPLSARTGPYRISLAARSQP
ncbi:DUF3253 domain-containing protein [Sphingomonas fuzhouensis]|uniref:DUF3253 domain-containing protein n=1 Tax=Sphingomonas fuzhouensis TaxID=3106033 RepID=UPI002AFFD692|nr:DUF3253 domain-containing protein [Sphingomonas sp. SGZ-02]